MSQNKITIVDSNNQMHRAYYAYRGLQNNGNPASIVYGMPSIINFIVRQFRPHKLYLCWDDGRSTHRMKLLPTYKGSRKEHTTEEMESFDKQKRSVMWLFHCLGIKQLISRGMEADDWIYMLVRKYKKDPNNLITIISNDKDFHQLICSNVRVYNTHKRLLIHKDNCKVEYGYHPQHCVDYLCLVGDDSDNIPGMRGIGEARAKGFISRNGSIKEYLDSPVIDNLFEKDKLRRVYRLNRQLINLRVFYNIYLKGKVKFTFYKDSENPQFNKLKLIKVCNRYGIKMFKEKTFYNIYRKWKK